MAYHLGGAFAAGERYTERSHETATRGMSPQYSRDIYPV